MTISEAIKKSGIPRLDAELLLSSVLGKDRAWVIAHGNDPFPEDQHEAFARLTERRAQHEPIAYILGEKEFYRRSFFVDSRVLIPRPATEGLIHAALRLLDTQKEGITKIDGGIVAAACMLRAWDTPPVLVDVGTGSGCIAVTLALELPQARVIATDASAEALAVAKHNAERHDVGDRIEFREGDLLEPLQNLQEPFVIVSNPPYIPDGQLLMDDVALYEPHAALFAGPDGADVLRRLTADAAANPHCCGYVVECRSDQVNALHSRK